ncbi:MAG: IS30 family transposase [Pseudomonadota bacterium]
MKLLKIFADFTRGQRRAEMLRIRVLSGSQTAAENLLANRPVAIKEQSDFGHWEADLMIFCREYGKANVTSLIERKSRYLFAARNQSRHSEPIFSRIGEKLGLLPPSLRRTLTIDRGTEFASYRMLKDELGTHSYFCDPAAPHQKSAVENTNRRLR